MPARFVLALAVLLAAPSALAQTETPPETPTDSTEAVEDIEVILDANESRAQFNTAQGHLRAGRFEQALAGFDEGIRLDVSNPRNYYGRALALAQLERLEDAASAFADAQIRATDAGDDEIAGLASTQLLALALVQSNTLLQETPVPPANAQRVVDLLGPAEDAVGDDTSANYYYFLARAYNALEDYTRGARYGELATEAAPEGEDNSAVWYEYGFALMNQGDAEGARAAYEQALEGAYAGWAEYQLAQMDAAAGGSQ